MSALLARESRQGFFMNKSSFFVFSRKKVIILFVDDRNLVTFAASE